MTSAACTIVSPNYLAYARTVAASYLAQHPDHGFFVLIVADTADPAPFTGHAFTPVMLHETHLCDLRSEAMKYDILELNTNVKPAFLRHLLHKHSFETLIYLDPDIFIYSPLTPVFDLLSAGATAVLTPHLTAPVNDGRAPSEQDLLINGTYNLGFIAVRNCPEALRLLDWWDCRCLGEGFAEGRTGLFVDQKWINLAPGLFADIAIIRHIGCNMAYWNLHERTLSASVPYTVTSPSCNPVPLCFFHFSGIRVDDPQVLSRNQNRFTLAERPDLQTLFAEYKATVIANRDPVAEAVPYGFNQFSDGTSVTALARRIYAKHQARFAEQDPFAASGTFAAFARARGLVKGVIAEPKAGWGDFNPRDRRVEAIHNVLKLILRIIGPHKYELLMRYLGHISVLRHQAVFLRDPDWPVNEAGK